MALPRNLVQGGARYLLGLVDAILDDDVAIGVAVPYMHGDGDLAEGKPPWFPFEMEVLDGGAAGRRRRTCEVISQRGTNLRALEHRERRKQVGHDSSTPAPCLAHGRALAQTGSEHGAHEPRSHRDNALRNTVRAQHLALRDAGSGRRGTADDGTAREAIADESRASRRVRSTTGVADHREAIDAKVVGQPANVACRALVAAS